MLTFQLPYVLIDNVMLRNQDDRLGLSIRIVVEEQTNDSLLGEWFNDDLFRQFVSVVVDVNGKERHIPFDKLLQSSPALSPEQLLEFHKNKEGKFEIPYEFDVIVPGNIKDLVVSARSKVNHEGLMEEFGFDVDKAVLQSPVTSELVLQDGVVPTQSFGFLTPMGDPWVGDVRIINEDDEISAVTPAGMPLIIIPVDNFKIQDMRIVEDINEERTFDFNFLQNNPLIQKSSNRFAQNHFGDLLLSRNDANECLFLFPVNILQVIKDNSTLSFIFDGLTEREKGELVDDVRLINISMKRRRIDDSGFSINALGVASKALIPFDEEDPLLITAGGERGGFFSNAENELGTIQPIMVHGTPVGVRHFEGIDQSIAQRTTGKFAYIAEVMISDPSFDYVKKRLGEIDSFEKWLNEYTSLVELSGNYNFKSQRITNQFFAMLDDEEAFVQEMNQHIANFFKARRIFNQKPDSGIIDPAVRLQAFISPFTATLESLKFIQRTVEIFSSRIEDLSGIELEGLGSADESKQKSSKNEMRTLSVSKQFPTLFDVDVTRDSRCNIFDDPGEPQVLRIPASDLVQRSQNETLKFFKKDSGDVSFETNGKVYSQQDDLVKNSLSFFSPKVIRTPGISLNVGKGGITPKGKKELNRIASSIISTNKQIVPSSLDFSNKNIVPREELEIKTDLTNIFGAQGVSISVPLKLGDTLSPVDDAGELADPSIRSKQQPLPIEGSSTEFLLGLRNQDLVKDMNPQKPMSSFFDVADPNNPIDEQQIEMADLPNQLKSMIIPSNMNDLVRFDWFGSDSKAELDEPESLLSFYFHYSTLFELQALVGYREGDGHAFVKDPIWQKMTPSLFNGLAGKDAFVVCRVRRYENKKLNIKSIKELELPLSNEFFVIDMKDAQPFSGFDLQTEESIAMLEDRIGSRLNLNINAQKLFSKKNLKSILL
jgi:hypothetical protein